MKERCSSNISHAYQKIRAGRRESEWNGKNKHTQEKNWFESIWNFECLYGNLQRSTASSLALLSLCATQCVSLFLVFIRFCVLYFPCVWLVICFLNNKYRQVETGTDSVCHIIFIWKLIIPDIMPHQKRCNTKETRYRNVCVWSQGKYTAQSQTIEIEFRKCRCTEMKDIWVAFRDMKRRVCVIQICCLIPVYAHNIEQLHRFVWTIGKSMF